MVVIFSHNNEEYVSAAPKQWLCEEENAMMWPGSKVIERKAIKLNMKPEEDWIKYTNIKVVGYYATLKEATDVERKKQISSSSSGAEDKKTGKRKITYNRKYRDDSISPPPEIEITVTDGTSPNNTAFPSMDDIMKSNIMFDGTVSSENNLIVIQDERNDLALKQDTNSPTLTSVPSNITALGENAESVSVQALIASASEGSSTGMSDSAGMSHISGISGSSKSIDEFLSELKQIKSYVTYTMRKVDAIELSLARLNFPSEPKQSMLPNLPLTELTQLISLEEKLSDESIQKELYDMLRHTGGTKERDCVNRCLEKVFSNYLGQYCSWTGKKNNFKLSSLKLTTTMKLAVRHTFPNMTDESFERSVMNWFQHATTRLKRENEN